MTRTCDLALMRLRGSLLAFSVGRDNCQIKMDVTLDMAKLRPQLLEENKAAKFFFFFFNRGGRSEKVGELGEEVGQEQSVQRHPSATCQDRKNTCLPSRLHPARRGLCTQVTSSKRGPYEPCGLLDPKGLLSIVQLSLFSSCSQTYQSQVRN